MLQICTNHVVDMKMGKAIFCAFLRKISHQFFAHDQTKCEYDLWSQYFLEGLDTTRASCQDRLWMDWLCAQGPFTMAYLDHSQRRNESMISRGGFEKCLLNVILCHAYASIRSQCILTSVASPASGKCSCKFSHALVNASRMGPYLLENRCHHQI